MEPEAGLCTSDCKQGALSVMEALFCHTAAQETDGSEEFNHYPRNNSTET